MNKILLILYVLVTSSIVFAQSDSLNTQKWKSQHSVGVELGGGLYPYSLNYQFVKIKNKHQIGGVFKASVFKLPSPLLISQGLFFKYAYGKKHNFTITTGAGIYIEPKNYTSDFSFKLKNEKIEAYFTSYLIGYEMQKTHFTFGLNAGLNGFIIYNALLLPDFQLQFYHIPMIGLNFLYNI